MMNGRRLSNSGERSVTKVYPSPSTKEEWKNEAENQDLSLSRYLHHLIQEARVLRDQGRLQLGDRRRVEELQERIDELETQVDRHSQPQSQPDATSMISNEILEDLLEENYKPLNQILKQLVGSEQFQEHLRTELKSELYRLANNGKAEYRRGSGWKKVEQ